MSSRRYQLEKDKKVKERLLKVLEAEISKDRIDEEGISLIEKLLEWLDEDYGIIVKGDWNSIEKIILSSKEISARDLAVFMISEDIEIDESYWYD